MKRVFGRLVGTAGAIALGVGAYAQSFNVDVDNPFAPPELGGGAPSAQFGAAAHQTGQWNLVDVGGRGPQYLNMLDGVLSSVLLTGPLGGGGVGFNNPNNSGDFGLLMNDWRDVGGGNDQIWTISGLANGRYNVFTYAATPSSLVRTTSITVWTPQYLQTKTVTNLYAFGEFAEGKTHSVHEFNVTDGTFNFRFEVSSLSQYFNGMQIVAVPEPATLAIWGIGLASLALRRKRQAPP